MFYCYAQHKVLSKIELHTSWNKLQDIQVPKFDFNYKKLQERRVHLWTMYNTISNSFNFLS
jgi:hypothetical protein